MKPILLYSHAEEPITNLMLSGELDREFNPVKISLEELLNDTSILDEFNENETKIEWTLVSGDKISNTESFYLINRVLSVPEELFNDFAEEDRHYSINEFRAYLAFALEAFPKSSSKPGAFGLSGNRLSLPRQWETVRRSVTNLNVPNYYLGNIDHMIDAQSLVHSDPHDYYYWKPSKGLESTSFAFERPKGIPVISCIAGEGVETFAYQSNENISSEHQPMLKEISRALANIFNFDIAEILLFLDDDKISFGMISNIPYASKKRPWFSSMLKTYIRNEISR